MMKSSNPTLSEDTFSRYGYPGAHVEGMTAQGVVYKTLILLLFTLLSAGFVWHKFFEAGGNAQAISTWIWVGAIGGFIVAIATTFKPEWASVTGVLYAVLEGLFIGGISSVFEASYPGIVVQATGLTFTTLAAMLFAYQSGLIVATDKFKMGVVAATGGLALFYLVAMVLGLFGVNLNFVFGGGWFGIGFSLFAVAVASLNFILDFDFIEQGAKRGAPKYMEWYGAFALMVTLIWLYVEFLRLLSKLRER